TTATLYASVNHAKRLSEIRPAGKTLEGVVSWFATLIPTNCISPFRQAFPFAFIYYPTPAKPTAPGDRGWKQRATAVQRRTSFERQNARYSRERRLQERELLQGRRFLTDRKSREP